jgi:hypothetical protein
MRVKKYNVAVSDSISGIDMAGRIEYNNDYSNTSRSVDRSTINDIARIHLASLGEAASSTERDSKSGPSTEDHGGVDKNKIQDNLDIDDGSKSSKNSRSRPKPPAPSPASIGSRIKNEEQDDQGSTEPQASLYSPSASESSLLSPSSSSSSSSGYSTSDSDSSTEDRRAKSGDDDKGSAIALKRPEHRYPENNAIKPRTSIPSAPSSPSSASSASSTSPNEFKFPSSIYRQGTHDKMKSEENNQQDDPSSDSSTDSSKSTDDTSREQRTEPNAAEISAHEGYDNNHDNLTTSDKGEQEEEYHYWYLQDVPENDDDRLNKGKDLEANRSSEDKNDSENENEISKAIKNLRSPSKSPGKRVDDTKGVEERQLPHSQKLESKVNLGDDERNRFQEAASENEQGSTRTIPRIDGNNGIDAEQEHGNDSQSVEVQKTMDRERRFQLWLEYGVYVPASGSSGSSKSQSSPSSSSPSSSSPSSAVSTKGTHVKENESSKKWWKRMGSLFHRREGNTIPKQESSSTSYSKGRENDPEMTNERDDAIDMHGSIDRAPAVVSKKRDIEAQEYPDIENFGISQVKPNPVVKHNDQLEIKDGLNEPSGKNMSLAVAAAATGKVKTQQSPMTEEDYDKLDRIKNEMSITGGSFADQVASLSRARTKNKSQPQSAEDYDKLYQTKNETSFTGGSLADQVAAAARSKKKNKSPLRSAEDFDKLYQTKNELKETKISLTDQIAAAAMARKLKTQSAPMTEEEYDKLYEPKKDAKSTESSLADQVAAAAMAMKLKKQSAPTTEKEYDELYKPKKEIKSTESSLADQVAAAAMTMKLKKQTAPMTEEEYDKLYKPKKEIKSTESSLADQVAAAAMAVKLKNQSVPMTEADYDKIYDSRKVMDSMDISLSDKVASAAMAVKLKNKTTPMTKEDYDKLYEPRKERKDTDESLANQIAAAAIARKKYKSEEDYGNLYKKPKRLDEEPQHMVNLKFTNEGRPSARRILQDHPENNVSNRFEEDFEISISSSNASDDKSGRELKENPISANPLPSTTYSASFQPPKSKRAFGPFVCCVNIMIVVVPIAVLVYFLGFADFKNDSESSAPGAPNDPNFEITRFPSRFPSLPAPSKPTTFITYTQSSMPSFRRSTNPPTSQPISKPVLDPTVEQTFPTATPVSTPLTNSPTQSFIDIDKPAILSPSLVSTNQPVLNTEKPILPEASESPQVDHATFLRQLLVSRWPPLKQSLFVPSSPQNEAFEWLVDLNSELDGYSERQLLQRFVMATFFFSTNGENWSNNEGWLSAENECRWYQTKSYRDHCDASGSLLNLELNGNGLSGSLPSELALLSDSLTRLDLAKTDDSNEAFLSGNLPSEIGLLTMLHYISLSQQQMSGTLPYEIGKLSLLTVLDLERNKFEGSLMANIGDLQQLYNLYIGFNNLSGDIASEVGRLQFLVNLDLRGNRFSSSLPSELGKLSFLQSLSLGDNKLTGTIPSFLGQLSNLRGTFDLSGNLLNGTIPTTLGQLSMLLTVLNLSSNELSGPIPTELDRLVKLGNLQLQNNLLTGSIPPSFYKLSQLQILQLQYNNLTGDVTAAVCDNLVTNKIDDEIVPTSLLTDCLFKVNCECCQYCCAEGTGCECQFTKTDQDFLCRHGDVLGPKARIVNINN